MIDLHMHSTCSDGTDSVETLIKNVAKAGIDFFSITDHDTAHASRMVLEDENLKKIIKESNLTFVPGIEFSCVLNGRNTHILAYDIDPFSKEVIELEAEYSALSKEKDKCRFKIIEDAGFVLSEKSKEFLSTRENIRDPDIANCLVNDGYFDDIEKVFSEFIRKINYPRKYLLDPYKVIKTMSEVGAKLVWAHPLHGLNQKPLTFEQVEEIATDFKNYGLVGLECYYSLYNKEEIEGLKKIAKKLGLYISGGSDYHGKNKKIKLAQMSSEEIDVDDKELNIVKTFKNLVN